MLPHSRGRGRSRESRRLNAWFYGPGQPVARSAFFNTYSKLSVLQFEAVLLGLMI